MKIKKERNIILEAADRLLEADEDTVQQALDNAGETPVELDDASVAQVAAEIQKGAAEDGKVISAKDAVAEAKKVFAETDLIRNPYGGATLGTITAALQRSLDTILRKKDLNRLTNKQVLKGDYPNIVIYGSAGFAKTALVEKFCADHGINMFPIDVKTLDLATVGGIPYPKKDADGELTQMPVASGMWKGLDLPNTVIFLDELNRANGRIRGTLLSLVNNHILPIVREEDGKVMSTKFFPNILFTVTAVNPSSDLYRDASDLDPAEISRYGTVIEQTADVREYYNYINDLFTTIEKFKNADPDNPELQKILEVFIGQGNLARAILLDKSFEFDDDNDTRQNNRDAKKQGKLNNPLNYRTFFLTLQQCDGTKSDYLYVIEKLSGFSPTRVQMIKNILSTYTDKPTTGNTVWNQASTTQQKARAARAATETAKALDDFAKMLGN